MRLELPLTLTLLASLAPALQAGSPVPGQAEEALFRQVENAGSLNYLLHLPLGYEQSDQAYPLLLFLHGIAQKGDGSPESLQKVSTDGPFRTMREGLWDQRLPLIVIGPQSGGIQPWWRGEEVREVLTHVMDTYRVDPSRRYLSGISMGGRSAWWLAKNFASEFAALVPASSWAGDVSHSCNGLNHMGIWAFHGRRDPLIGLSAGRKPIDALTRCTPPLQLPPRLTVLEDAGHGQWHRIYGGQFDDSNTGGDGALYSDIYRWMMSFNR